MKERPIIFTGEMVRAILEGRKTQTRRVVKFDWCRSADELLHQASFDPAYKCPYGKVGDRLWVRETWRMDAYNIAAEYRATTSALLEYLAPWKPSIHMPRWASRITLDITGVRVNRLQDISEDDAKAEGAERGIYCEDDDEGPALRSIDCESDERLASHRDGFRFIWECINGPGSWDSNPFVWVIEFRKEAKP